jgi:hypothetical protein
MMGIGLFGLNPSYELEKPSFPRRRESRKFLVQRVVEILGSRLRGSDGFLIAF